jgi:hypothetical protein
MQTQTTIPIYSAYSGTFYEILEKDVNLLISGQIPLKKYPNKNCKKCYGRGHLGRNSQSYDYLVCDCIRKNINFDLIASLASNNK